MGRVYYNEERIYGQAIETSIINIENFDLLMKSIKPSVQIELAPVKAGIPDSLGSSQKKRGRFRYTRFSDDGIQYNSAKGNFYLPKAIIFYDVNDFVFPTLFYFIAKIKGQLEIRYVKGGESVKWYQIADMHQQVTKRSIIKKIELTLEDILILLENYTESEKPQIPMNDTTLNVKSIGYFFILLDELPQHSKIIEIAASSLDGFDLSRNIAAALEETGKMITIDWKASYYNVLRALEKISGIEFDNTDSGKYRRSTAGKILSSFNRQVEEKTNKTIFCIDTGNDSYSFGLVEKNMLPELIKTGKDLGIEVCVII